MIKISQAISLLSAYTAKTGGGNGLRMRLMNDHMVINWGVNVGHVLAPTLHRNTKGEF